MPARLVFKNILGQRLTGQTLDKLMQQDEVYALLD